MGDGEHQRADQHREPPHRGAPRAVVSHAAEAELLADRDEDGAAQQGQDERERAPGGPGRRRPAGSRCPR